MDWDIESIAESLTGDPDLTLCEHKLTRRERDSKPDTAFALPAQRKYPIDDRTHAANALSRSAGKPVAGKIRRRVCSRYPDMASCSEAYLRRVYAHLSGAVAEEAGWKAQLHSEPVIVTQQQADGTVKRLRVMKYWVTMDDGRHRLVFRVSKGRDGHPVFTDDRETRTGAAAVTHQGPLPGEAYAKPGQERKLTATGWAEQVERLIGPAEIGKIFVGLVRAGFKPG